MSFNSNFSNSNLAKPIALVVVILLVIGGSYYFFGKKSTNNDAEASKINDSGLDKNQKVRNVGDVEEVVAAWIANNPQAIIDSVTNMQKKMMEEQAKNAQVSISSKKSELFDSKSPSYAPKGYDITIIEFFDYNCGYCKKANSTVEELLASDKKVRVIYKEFPILGQSSQDMTEVALAVHLLSPSSYRKFHNALMTSHASSKDEAIKIAGSVGVDIEKLKKTLSSQASEIAQIINSNRTLGSQIGIQGTPGFVIGDELIPGAVGIEELQGRIKAERKK